MMWTRVTRTAAVVAVLALAVACGGDDDTGTAAEDGDAATAEATTAAGAAFPLEVEHALGVTEVPAEPERVVTVGVTEQDVVLALGVTPVGVTEWYGEQP